MADPQVHADVILSPAQVTSEWLSDVLRRSGALETGAVDSFRLADVQERELSSSTRLSVRYGQGAVGDLPAELFLKTVTANYDDDDPLLVSEVDYYASDYLGVKGAPLVRCYDTALSEDGLRYHILMDDLSATHKNAWYRPVTLDYGLALAEGLAVLHAVWWGRTKLDGGGKSIPDAEAIERFVQFGRDGVGYILDNCAHELANHWPQAIVDIYENHPRLLVERAQDPNGFTLVHGDVNPGNVIAPVDADSPIYIIDRAPFEWSLTTWLGIYDLSYAIVTFWDIESRRQFERAILKRYHHTLMERGVNGYPWEHLYADYRLVVPMSVYVATEWCRGDGSEHKDMWMPMLRRALTAADDLQCSALWATQ